MLRKEKEQYFSRGFELAKSKIFPVMPPCLGAVIAAAMIVGSVIGLSQPAQALPSFARQTGQPCGTCHTDYPGLTPYGRLFKLNGYTTGGGKYRTTIFSTSSRPDKALAAYAKKTNDQNTTLSGQPDTSNIWVPPIAAMAVFGYTHTQAPQYDLDPWLKPNDNYTIPEVSLFWGGAVTPHIGAFSQWTYDGHQYWGWDNQDIRYSNTGKLGNVDVIYGVTLDNNPTLGDPWNTVPAWGFPYMSSEGIAAETPATLIDGGMEMAVAGLGAYGFFDNLVYLQVSGYRSINPNTLVSLGAGPSDAGSIDGVAPYWRAAIEPHWGQHWFEFGTFGMSASLHPWSDPDNFVQFNQTDRYTDIAFDSQYQYQGDNFWLTLRGTYIHEDQSLAATYAMGGSDNPTNTLNTLKLYGSFAYGGDNRIILSGQYFDVWGSTDASFYAGDASGFVGEIAYIPFMNNFAPLWPWANVRLGAKYTYYSKFEGTSVGAQDHNTFFLYAWVAM
jgi:hypothetical protein